MNKTDLTKYYGFRIMPTTIGKISTLEGQPIIQMKYKDHQMNDPQWSVEGKYEMENPNYPGEYEVDEICECSNGFTAVLIADLLEKERIYQEDNKNREKRRSRK